MLESPEVEKFFKKLMKVRNLENLGWLQKSKFHLFCIFFLKRSFSSTYHNFIVQCALQSPDQGQQFNKHLDNYHIIHRKVFRAT